MAPAMGAPQMYTSVDGVAAPRPAVVGDPAAGTGRSVAAVGAAVGAIGAATAVKGRKQVKVEAGVSATAETMISNRKG
eukprot:9783545-Heterocapsa_arctica.AAC.1